MQNTSIELLQVKVKVLGAEQPLRTKALEYTLYKVYEYFLSL